MWAFGHTHYSCAFRNHVTDTLVVSNQKDNGGIVGSGESAKRMKTVAVEQTGDRWQVVEYVQVPGKPGWEMHEVTE